MTAGGDGGRVGTVTVVSDEGSDTDEQPRAGRARAMHVGYTERSFEHETGALHPDSPDRVRAILDRLEGCADVTVARPDPIAAATARTVHDGSYLTDLAAFCETGGGRWDPDTVASPATMDAALASAGVACWAAERALARPPTERTPFGLCRPPGHHALPDDATGFCFLNNAAIAAEVALDRPAVDRVAVFDWDVHHGNGVQEVFYDRSDVFYASIHERGLFPGTGSVNESGTGPGRGTTLNVPFPPEAGDAEYVAAVESVVGPRINAFDPDLVLVCAGFDAKAEDHTSNATVSTEGFARLTVAVREVAAGTDAALGFVLEGGYQLAALAEGVYAVHRGLTGQYSTESSGPPDPRVTRILDTVEDSTTEA